MVLTRNLRLVCQYRGDQLFLVLQCSFGSGTREADPHKAWDIFHRPRMSLSYILLLARADSSSCIEETVAPNQCHSGRRDVEVCS
jgi:hypothetical protein